MAMDTTLRPTTAGGTGGTLGTRTNAPSPLLPARPTTPVDGASASAPAAPPATAAPLRSGGSAALRDGALQDKVARAQQALDYLDRVSTQLETLKGELTAKLAGTRNGARLQLEAQVRQLTKTLAARRQDGGASVDSNLNFSAAPAVQRFRIRGLDIASLRKSAPQTLSFSVGSLGGPQMSVNIDPDQSNQDIARALDRALAPMGVRARLDDKGELVFVASESDWPAIKDSIAVSGRGRVTTEEVPASLAPDKWNVNTDTGLGNPDALRQSLREVVQALERVHRSQVAASDALAAASAQVAAAEAPAPNVTLAAEDFTKAAASTDYESLLALTSALVGVSRDRVLALLGLR